MSSHAAPTRGRRLKRMLAWAGVIAAVATTVGLIGWRLQGGRWERVETASMGTVAPVGTLLWVEPVSFSTLRVGDFVTFSPPGSRGTTYSHLVRSVNSDGTISTQGTITAPDPWRLHPENVIGKVVMHWRGIGWLIVAAPILVIGGGLVVALVRRMRATESRLAVAILGGAVVFTLAVVIYRPFVNAQQLAFVPAGHAAKATYVNTGLLPVRLSAPDSRSVVLQDGQVGSIRVQGAVDAAATSHRFTVAVAPAVPLAWWLGLIGLCFLPAVGQGLVLLVRTKVLNASPGRRHPAGSRRGPGSAAHPVS